MKLWDKGYKIDHLIESFTSSKDRELDIYLAEYDIKASMAHARMLSSIGMISNAEEQELLKALEEILHMHLRGELIIEEDIEDIHSQIEHLLILRIGNTGKKIHLARSRNDQILTDLRLYYRKEAGEIKLLCAELAQHCLQSAEKYLGVLMPGYTHSQLAMISSYDQWFGCFAEALIDDCIYLRETIRLIDSNPLGTAAGYGSSIAVDREMTTELMDFDRLCINPMYAQMTRGKAEFWFASSLASIAMSLNKMCADLCLYSNENYRFFALPKEFTTGSSIMPHKKNPDVFELIRARTNLIQSLPGQISGIFSNMISGYHRDFQLLKEIVIPAVISSKEILSLMIYSMNKLEVTPVDTSQDKYKYLFSVEQVNKLVRQGMSFRDAYRKIGEEIESGSFKAEKFAGKSHIGSIGNPGIGILQKRLESVKS